MPYIKGSAHARQALLLAVTFIGILMGILLICAYVLIDSRHSNDDNVPESDMPINGPTNGLLNNSMNITNGVPASSILINGPTSGLLSNSITLTGNVQATSLRMACPDSVPLSGTVHHDVLIHDSLTDECSTVSGITITVSTGSDMPSNGVVSSQLTVNDSADTHRPSKQRQYRMYVIV